MVDAISGAGAPQNALSTKNAQQSQNDQRKERIENRASSGPADEVTLSEEAVSLSQAEELALQTRAYLEKNTDETLGRGNQFSTLL